nr:uncharacterized mitochondrial protein AtMg00810-like [Tanacetum cinerariifolium]
MAFVSSSNNNSTNGAVNTALGVSTAGTQVNTTNIDNLSDAVICAFLASQPSSPQLINEDLELIHLDDLKGMDLRWECRAPRSQDTKHKESIRRSVPVETHASTALVSCDGLGGYDWSDQVEEGLNYALMAYTSTSSDSNVSTNSTCTKSCLETIKNLKSHNEHLAKDLKKSKLMVVGYKSSLESIEERLKFFQTNESVYLEDIKLLKVEIQMKDITIKDLRRKLEIADNCKKGLGYESYNAVPPPYIGNFMPLKPDLSYIRLDEFAVKLIVENKSSEVETKAVRKNLDALIVEEPKAVVNAVRGNVVSVVEASACWVWKPKTKVIDHVSKHNSASITLKKFDYGNPQIDLQDKGVINSGCSRGNPKEGKITAKGILRQYSVAKTPQQNRVAEKRNRTLIEAARTMLADSKLPTTFWAETVNNACYVQNRVLVVKRHNKTPYELFHDRTSALSFMKPLGRLVTILNTLDHLGKFNGIQSNGFAGTKSCDSAGQARKEKEPVKDYILLPLWTVDEDPSKGSECRDQEKDDNVYSTNNVNVASINEVNTVSENISNELLFDLNISALEDIRTFNFSSDHEDDDEEADMNNMNTTIQTLVDLPNGKRAIGTNWVFQNKKDKREVKNASTPMETQKPLLNDEDGEEVDFYIYRSMIGLLMYLTSSKPDIMFAMCACARYQVNPKVSHLHVVKRIFRYLKGQPKFGLWYLKDSLFDLVAYTDSDYAGASLDKKSTIGGSQFLRCRLISW